MPLRAPRSRVEYISKRPYLNAIRPLTWAIGFRAFGECENGQGPGFGETCLPKGKRCRATALQNKKGRASFEARPRCIKTLGIYLVLGAAVLAIAVELVLVVALVPEAWATDAVETDAVFCVKPLARSLLGT